MKIFVDSANLSEIRRWLDYGIADGVTTNPSIMLKNGVCDIAQCAQGIAALVAPRLVSLEVTTNHLGEMVAGPRVRFLSPQHRGKDSSHQRVWGSVPGCYSPT